MVEITEEMASELLFLVRVAMDDLWEEFCNKKIGQRSDVMRMSAKSALERWKKYLPWKNC